MRIAATLILSAVFLDGAAVMKGRIVLNEVNGVGVKDVIIKAPTAANQTLSTIDGTFTLKLPNHKPGDRIKLEVNLPGLAVVNWPQLNAVLASDYKDANELKLILAKAGRDREEMARRYFRLRSLEAVEAKYKHLLTKEGQDRARLVSELEKVRSDVDRLAEKLAKLRPEQSPARYEQAMRLYLEGKVDEAIESLNVTDLRKLSQAAKEQETQTEKLIADVKEYWQLRGQILTTQGRYAEANEAFAAAVALAPRDFESCFDHARSMDRINAGYDKVAKGYDRCLLLARGLSDRGRIAKTLCDLGDLHFEWDRREEARRTYEAALAFYRELNAASPDNFLQEMAETLDSLGKVYLKQVQLVEAGEAYSEALKYYRKLYAVNPSRYQEHVAIVLEFVGSVNHELNQPKEAREAYEEALAKYRKLDAPSTSVFGFLPNIALLLSNLGVLHRDQNRMGDAKRAFEEALEAYRKLAADSPDTYLPEVARVLRGLGRMHAALNQSEQARRALREAVQILEKLAERDREQYQALVNTVNAELERLQQ